MKPDFIADDDVVGSYLDELCRDPAERLAYFPGYWFSHFEDISLSTAAGLEQFEVLLQQSRSCLSDKVFHFSC